MTQELTVIIILCVMVIASLVFIGGNKIMFGKKKETSEERFNRKYNKKETEAERWSRIEAEQEATSLYASTMYSQIYETEDGALYYQADNGKQFRLVDESNEAKVIKEAVEIEKAQIKDRALLI